MQVRAPSLRYIYTKPKLPNLPHDSGPRTDAKAAVFKHAVEMRDHQANCASLPV